MTVETIEIDSDNRIVVEYDEGMDNPRTDWDCEIGHMFYIGVTSNTYLPPDGEETDYEYAFHYFWDRQGYAPDVFERWLRINFGSAYVETMMMIDRSNEALIYVTQEDIVGYGWEERTEEEIRGYLRDALETYRQWANGEVYVVTHETRREYVRFVEESDEAWLLDMNDRTENWETVDSIGGVYLSDEYTVHDVATEHFDVN